MHSIRPGSRAFREIRRATRTGRVQCSRRGQQRCIHSRHLNTPFLPSHHAIAGLFLAIGLSFIYNSSEIFSDLHAESPPAPVDFKIEKTKKRAGLSKEQNRDSISSQHLQVKRSWENPGVYTWGSNSGRVAQITSTNTFL